MAQSSGVRARLTSCPGKQCGVVFYDESKNASRVWHDSRTCGNRHNLQQARARRRSTAECPPRPCLGGHSAARRPVPARVQAPRHPRIPVDDDRDQYT
ncbi:CGNR zinc finger domain-containing protein [Streptomyces sp. NPDC026672]|uniref:CGNR zinc finger domain-containing protein n=1 Tax=unclassified Streptomyces TaxID=2593676 RepID=UPI0033FBE587